MRKNKVGKVIIPEGVRIWPHELNAALVLKDNGYIIEFIKAKDQKGRQTADCLINGKLWEIKSPRASNLKAVERNLKRAKWQSSLVVFDSTRMKHIPEKAIRREVINCFTKIDGIKQIKYINKQHKIIDIP